MLKKYRSGTTRRNDKQLKLKISIFVKVIGVRYSWKKKLCALTFCFRDNYETIIIFVSGSCTQQGFYISYDDRMCFKYFYSSTPLPKETVLANCQQYGAELLLLDTPQRRNYFLQTSKSPNLNFRRQELYDLTFSAYLFRKFILVCFRLIGKYLYV